MPSWDHAEVIEFWPKNKLGRRNVGTGALVSDLPPHYGVP